MVKLGIPPRPGDHFERFGWREADAAERSLRTLVAEIPKPKGKRGWVAFLAGERERMKKLLKIFAISGSILVLSACNTVQGAGKDVESVGDCADGVKGNC